jgi:hypothetical protein
MCSSGFWRRVNSPVDANVLEELTVSIFRANVATLASIPDPCKNSILHNKRRLKSSRNTKAILSIGQIAMKPIDITRGVSDVNNTIRQYMINIHSTSALASSEK